MGRRLPVSDSRRHVVVYVAGPYRSNDGARGVQRNIHAARLVAEELWKAGFTALCPHLNSQNLDGPGGDTDGGFLEGGLVLLSRCDAVVLVEGWESSRGTQQEVELASECSIPVFDSVEDLLASARKELTQ